MTSGSDATSSMRYPVGSMKVLASSAAERGVYGALGVKSVASLVIERPPNPPGAGA